MRQKDLTQTIMRQIKSGDIQMKPRWYFLAGSFLALIGLISASVLVLFSLNVILFLARRSWRPLISGRLALLLPDLPFWLPILALGGIWGGIWLLRRYDFSYRRHFGWVVATFLLALILGAWGLDRLGLNEFMAQRTPLRQFYRQLEPRGNFPSGTQRPGGQVRGWRHSQ